MGLLNPYLTLKMIPLEPPLSHPLNKNTELLVAVINSRA
jgi:hypothetical protein